MAFSNPLRPRVLRPSSAPSRGERPPERDSFAAELSTAAESRDRDALEALLAQLPTRSDPAPFELTVSGVQIAEAGFPDLAERVLLAVVERRPDYALAHFEMGRLSIRNEKRPEAVARLTRAVDAAAHEFRYRHLLAHMLLALEKLDEAESHIARLSPRSPDEQARTEVLRSFAEYLRAFPRERAQTLVQTVRQRYAWIDAAALGREIETAVAERRPFALIRFGDGEAAFAETGPEDEARYAPLYRWMRESWVRFLFGPEFDPESTGYAALTRTLMAVSAEADVLGVPYPTWIDHEYATASIRGVPCTLNVHRWLLANPSAKPPLLCDQIVHIVLHNEGLIAPILRGAGEVTVISCLTGLSELIQQRFELEEVRLIAVPREHTAPHLQAAGHVDGAAFPDAFDRTMAQLAQPHEGRVFIVAAGTLGKFYAAQIKRHGGIALDLGSLVDGWMRLPSREGYGGQFAL